MSPGLLGSGWNSWEGLAVDFSSSKRGHGEDPGSQGQVHLCPGPLHVTLDVSLPLAVPLSVGCGLIFLCQSKQLSWFTRDAADLGIETLMSWEAPDPGHTGTVGHHTQHISSLTV